MIKKTLACILCISSLCAMDHITRTAVTYRTELILRMSRDPMRKLPPTQYGRYVFGHPKAIRHYLLTGETIDEARSDELISDEQFLREYIHSEIALSMKFAALPPEEQKQTALNILSDYHAKIAQGFANLGIISTLLNGRKDTAEDEDI